MDYSTDQRPAYNHPGPPPPRPAAGAAAFCPPETTPPVYAAAPVDPTWTIVGLIAIPILVVVNGFFVAAEFALVAVRKTRVEELVNQNAPGAAALSEAVTHLNRSVAGAQLGITVASLALGFVSEPALAALIQPLFDPLPDAWKGAVTRTASVALTLGLITYLHVVFGEQMPKIAALKQPERVATWVARPVNVFARCTGPLIRLMNGSSDWLLRRAGYGGGDGHAAHAMSVEELSLLVEDTEEAGRIDSDYAEFVQNVFELSDKTVADIMVPREKVAGLTVGMSPDKILEAVRQGAHTRMPVFDGTDGKVTGIVNTKDLFYLFSLSGVVVLEDAMYDAFYLPPDEPVSTALRLFKKTKHPMAVVRDEGKKVLGILTLEDVLEEIVGDIEDEHDDPAKRRELAKLARKSGFVTRVPGKRP